MYISNISDCVLRRLHKKYQNDVNSNETLLSRTIYMSVSQCSAVSRQCNKMVVKHVHVSKRAAILVHATVCVGSF